MRHRRRSATMLAVVLPALALGACSDSPTNAEWADSVCTSLDAVKSDIAAIGDGLTLDLSEGALDQVKDQLAEDVTAVRESLEALLDSIEAAPANPGAQDLETALEGPSNDFEAAVQSLTDAATDAADATSLTEFLAAAGTAVSAVASASAAATAYATTVQTAASQAVDDVKAAFAEAPACQDALGTP